MNIEQWREYLLSFPASVEEMPFGPEVLVYKVAGKLFALLSWQDEPMSINLKCESNLALQLRDTYPQVTAGYHMNKKHWNTVVMDGGLEDAHIKEWVQASYDLIYNSLPKATQAQLPKHSIMFDPNQLTDIIAQSLGLLEVILFDRIRDVFRAGQ